MLSEKNWGPDLLKSTHNPAIREALEPSLAMTNPLERLCKPQSP